MTSQKWSGQDAIRHLKCTDLMGSSRTSNVGASMSQAARDLYGMVAALDCAIAGAALLAMRGCNMGSCVPLDAVICAHALATQMVKHKFNG